MKFFARFLLLVAAFLLLNEAELIASGPRILPGTHLLDSFARQMPAPEQKTVSRRNKRQFVIGSCEVFNTFNFANGQWEQTPAELIAIGENLYVYLETGKSFAPQKVAGLIKEFDEKIYPLTTRYFGHEARPGIDNDEHISILLMDIKDNYPQESTYTSGYFNRGDCYQPEEIPADVNLKTNCREMLYVDIEPSDTDSDEFFATIAHEFQHLIHFYHDSEEYSWLNEGCSQITTYLCGYGHPRQLEAYVEAPDNSLIAWAPWNQVANYGQVYLWTYYVMNQFCKTDAARVKFFNALVKDKEKGMASFDKQFKKFSADFAKVFADFSIAGFLNRPGIQPQVHGFGVGLPDFQLPATAFFERLPAMYRNSVSIWGADLIKARIEAGTRRLRIDFAGDLNSLPNSFAVAAVFVDERQSCVNTVAFINNIKSTTRNTSVSRVMLPGYDDNFPPPPPVKTQMGHIVAEVPQNSDCLYLVIMGKGPVDMPDSMLAWSGRANYRIDIKAMEIDEVVAPLPAVTANVEALLNNHRILAEGKNSDQEVFAAVCQEIGARVKAELLTDNQPLVSAINNREENHSLKRLVKEIKTFAEIHR